jgi:hypothetical protein
VNRLRVWLLFAFAALFLMVTVALAVPSCTAWMKQTDGSYFRTCVDDKGRQYCEVSKNGRVSRVACR